MAAYAATVASLMLRAVKIDQVTGIGMFAGRCDVTNYNTTLVAITAIRDKFKTSGLIAVVCEGVSDQGFIFKWVRASNAFKCWYPSNIRITTGSTAAADSTSGALIEDSAAAETVVRAMDSAVDTTYDLGKRAAIELAVDVDAGEVEFVAYGLV